VRGEVTSPDGYAGYFKGGRNYFEGNVGFGTNSPRYRIHNVGDYYGKGHVYLYAYEGDGNNGTAYLQARDDSGASTIDLQLRTQNAGTAVNAMRIMFDGKVGIGTTAPAVKLQVSGGTDAALAGGGYLQTGSSTSTNMVLDTNEIMARNNGAAATLFLNHEGGEVHVGQGSGGTGRLVTPVLQITGGADLSEGFEVGGADVRPGMVVVIDPANPGQLVPSVHAYDKKVAGIISGAGGVNTGLVMGQSGSVADGRHPVALTGRVWCLVDASDAIEPGDLLTTSNTPGHAMKAADYDAAQGAIIGKAMTALEEGRGLVLVLVSLQ
jgi:hypothetical protein